MNTPNQYYRHKNCLLSKIHCKLPAADDADANDMAQEQNRQTNQPTQISVVCSIHSLKNWLVGHYDMTFEVTKLLICPIEIKFLSMKNTSTVAQIFVLPMHYSDNVFHSKKKSPPKIHLLLLASIVVY